MTSIESLLRSWREEARRLRERYGEEALATLTETHVKELLEVVQAGEDELLPPADATASSGYSARRLRELVAQGRLPNRGRKGAPLYRRGDLPRRVRSAERFDPMAEVRRIVGGGG